MVGCFGSSKEDVYFSNQLNSYLDKDRGYTGKFCQEIEISLSSDCFLYVEVEGFIEDDKIVMFSHDGGHTVFRDEDTFITNKEIDMLVDIDKELDSRVCEIIEWELGV